VRLDSVQERATPASARARVGAHSPRSRTHSQPRPAKASPCSRAFASAASTSPPAGSVVGPLDGPTAGAGPGLASARVTTSCGGPRERKGSRGAHAPRVAISHVLDAVPKEDGAMGATAGVLLVVLAAAIGCGGVVASAGNTDASALPMDAASSDVGPVSTSRDAAGERLGPRRFRAGRWHSLDERHAHLPHHDGLRRRGGTRDHERQVDVLPRWRPMPPG
jgi:hypothetical protein